MDSCCFGRSRAFTSLDWMFGDLVLTNSSGVHAKKAGEYGLMAILMLQNHMTKYL